MAVDIDKMTNVLVVYNTEDAEDCLLYTSDAADD